MEQPAGASILRLEFRGVPSGHLGGVQTGPRPPIGGRGLPPAFVPPAHLPRLRQSWAQLDRGRGTAAAADWSTAWKVLLLRAPGPVDVRVAGPLGHAAVHDAAALTDAVEQAVIEARLRSLTVHQVEPAAAPRMAVVADGWFVRLLRVVVPPTRLTLPLEGVLDALSHTPEPPAALRELPVVHLTGPVSMRYIEEEVPEAWYALLGRAVGGSPSSFPPPCPLQPPTLVPLTQAGLVMDRSLVWGGVWWCPPCARNAMRHHPGRTLRLETFAHRCLCDEDATPNSPYPAEEDMQAPCHLDLTIRGAYVDHAHGAPGTESQFLYTCDLLVAMHRGGTVVRFLPAADGDASLRAGPNGRIDSFQWHTIAGVIDAGDQMWSERGRIQPFGVLIRMGRALAAGRRCSPPPPGVREKK